VQTFLPYDDYVASAKVLDRARLGKQRVETLQILNTLTGRSNGWVNHPAVRMWRGHELELAEYGVAVCLEWIGRGYKDSCLEKITNIMSDLVPSVVMPSWWGGDIHRTHRSKLLSKFPEHYRQFWPDEQDDLDYYWPV